jgi:predicted GNAT family N-acyltransferase
VTIRLARLDEILGLRHAVLRPGRPLSTARFDGDDDATTIHVGAFEGGTLVGCATLMRRPLDGEDAGQVRGMATATERVRQGIGTALLARAEAVAIRDWGLGLLWCNARTSARGFYERSGWSVVSPVFEIPDVGPHVRMIRRRV